MSNELQSYVPTVVTVGTEAGVLLAADNKLKTVCLTNTGSKDVWFCHGKQTPEVGKGFFLPAGKVPMVLDGDAVPLQGLNAIADGGSTTVAIGRG